MANHHVVNHQEWIEARKRFLAKEKALTHLRDELSQERRELPWERVEKNYVFDGPNGKETLADIDERKAASPKPAPTRKQAKKRTPRKQ